MAGKRGAGRHPAGEAGYVQPGLLRKKRAEHDSRYHAGRCPEDTVKALCEHHAGCRLHQDKDSHHRRARLWQFQRHCNTQRKQSCGNCLGEMKPHQAVARTPL
ncbi:hypothetical protein HDG32_001063 [Paraburkholderia sp. CI2]|nr:hypothetical protein [Paraburkholderia sp. CI2]